MVECIIERLAAGNYRGQYHFRLKKSAHITDEHRQELREIKAVVGSRFETKEEAVRAWNRHVPAGCTLTLRTVREYRPRKARREDPVVKPEVMDLTQEDPGERLIFCVI